MYHATIDKYLDGSDMIIYIVSYIEREYDLAYDVFEVMHSYG